LASVLIICSCNKTQTPDPVPGPTTKYVLKYPDSILYLKPQANDYIVSPTELRAGKYSGFPEGIEIDENTGAINVNKSESGLRYRITHISPSNDTTTTLVVISGITYTDNFFHLSTGDSICIPVYNASLSRPLPLSGSTFDEGNGANSGGCSVKTDNARINLAQCVRNGIFGATPTNDVRKDFDVFYRINDNSGKAQNKLKVRLYYYKTMADVAPDLMQTLLDRQQEGVFLGGRNSNTGAAGTNTNTTGAARTTGRAKPRPPCIIIIAI
jgi:hypothetical protein